MKRKGFTLIELLAVIIILGILMLIAIPSVTSYINNSRKETYVDTTKELIKGAHVLVNSGEIEVNDPNTTYYIPTSAIKTENGEARSPYGALYDAYIVVTYDGDNYDYYYIGKDEANMGTDVIVNADNLDKDKIKSNVDNISTDSGIGIREKIVVFDNDLKPGDPKSASKYINGDTGEELQLAVYPEGKNKETVVIGDIVTINNEEFYVVKHEGNDLVLLARYNLKVGNKYNSNQEKIGEYTSADDGFGIQSSSINACWYKDGNLQFSSTNYWNGKVGQGLKYNGRYCTDTSNASNCAYVFDSNSNLYSYVMNYKEYLESGGIVIKEARLLKLEEANLIYSAPNGLAHTIYNVCFWTGTPYNNSSDMWIAEDKSQYLFIIEYNSLINGVRPVIVI